MASLAGQRYFGTSEPEPFASVDNTLGPGLSKPSIHDVSWTLGRSRGVTIHVSTEESMVIQGAPRSGKGLYVVINAILDAPGAVVTTSTRADNLVVTMRARMSDGRPVTVFDPQGMSGLPSTLRWSPVRGCGDPDIATRRALVITADTEMKGENAAWQKRSLIVLQCLLHAAALSGEGIAAFRRWSSSPVLAREALDILGRPGAALGWQADLMGILEDDPRNTSNSWIGVSAAVAPLSSPRVLAALNPQDEAQGVRSQSLHQATGDALPYWHPLWSGGRWPLPVRSDRRHRQRRRESWPSSHLEADSIHRFP